MLIDFRKYKELIRKTVAQISKEDENWNWKVDAINKGEVRIQWGYLDYCGEYRNCFFLTFSSDPTDTMCDCCIEYRKPSRGLLDGIGIGGELFPDITPEMAIERAIKNIARYAHNVY